MSGNSLNLDCMLLHVDKKLQLLGLQRQLLAFLQAECSEKSRVSRKSARRASRGGTRRGGPHRLRR